jgi:hypothetical protein
MDELKAVLFSRSPNAAQPQVRQAHTPPLQRRASISHFGCQAKAAEPGCVLFSLSERGLTVTAVHGRT